MSRSASVLALLLILSVVRAGAATQEAPFGAASPAAPADVAPHHGVLGSRLYNRGQLVGTLDREHINCLGHAAGLDAAVFPGAAPLSETLEALGYQCSAGSHEQLLPALAAGRDGMMVYLHLYPIPWRKPADQVLSYAELALKYGWDEDAWKLPHLFFDGDGGSLPVDFHVLVHNRRTQSWEWVTERKPKAADGSYTTDSTSHDAATRNPDLYFPTPRVLASVACYR